MVYEFAPACDNQRPKFCEVEPPCPPTGLPVPGLPIRCAGQKYTDRVPDIINRYQGKILARGGRYQIMEGPADFHRFVVIEFPTLEQAVACFESPE